MIKIAPSILSADFTRLADEIKRLEKGGADLIHVDVMYGHFVRNISLGPAITGAVKSVARLPVDVHLMISHPGRYLRAFLEAGSDIITFHVEAHDAPVGKLIDEIHAAGREAGVALNPDTPVGELPPEVSRADMVLCMTVHPGFGGQSLIRESVPKIRQVREAYGDDIDVEVDGGVNAENVGELVGQGANIIVAGEAIFGGAEPERAIGELRRRGQAAYDAMRLQNAKKPEA